MTTQKQNTSHDDPDKLRFLDKLEKHKENTEKSAHYSLERFDVLIITLSSAALGFSIGFIKDIIPDFHNVNLTLLKISWFLFGISVIMNLVSQMTSYWGSRYEIKNTRIKIREIREKQHPWNKKRIKKYAALLDKATRICNIISLSGLIVGIVLVILFVSNNV